MANRLTFIRIWRQLSRIMHSDGNWLKTLGASIIQYGKPRYWLIYLAAFGLGFYLFGPTHGWEKFQDGPQRPLVEQQSGSIVALQHEVARLKADLKRISSQPAPPAPFAPESLGRPAPGKVVQGQQWVYDNKVWRLHPGVEIAVPSGSNVMAAADGKVLVCSGVPGGYSVTVDHGSDWETVYAQLSRTLVKEGESVKRGQVIGISGLSTCVPPKQPAFHFGIYHQKEPVDPQKIISGLK